MQEWNRCRRSHGVEARLAAALPLGKPLLSSNGCSLYEGVSCDADVQAGQRKETRGSPSEAPRAHPADTLGLIPCPLDSLLLRYPQRLTVL